MRKQSENVSLCVLLLALLILPICINRVASAQDISFYTANSFPLSRVTYDIVSADFNGDGKPDLATVSDTFVSIFLGRGDGTFATATEFFGTRPLSWLYE